MLRFRFISLALLSAVLGAALVGSRGASAASAEATLAVTGTVESGGTFAGVVTDVAFEVEGGRIVLTGVVEGVAVFEDGSEVDIEQAVVAAVAVFAEGGCGPVTVQVDAIVASESDLVIVLEPLHLEGNGNGSLVGGLLGGVELDLLCEIERLLDRPGRLQRVADLLNDLVAHER